MSSDSVQYQQAQTDPSHETDDLELNLHLGDEKKNLMAMNFTHSRQHFGTNLPLKFKNGRPKYTLGPHWPFFMFAWCAFLVVGLLMIRYLVGKGDWGTILLTTAIVGFQLFIYLYTALINPGIVSNPNPSPDFERENGHLQGYCKPCQIIKPKGTYHCYDCDVCIEGHDHHCPWTGKCIGRGNIIPFYIFLVSTVVFMSYGIIMCVAVTP